MRIVCDSSVFVIFRNILLQFIPVIAILLLFFFHYDTMIILLTTVY